MAGTSTYIQVSNYALIEYVYSQETIVTTKARPYRLYNNYLDEYHFLNGSSAISLTGNVLDRSSAKVNTSGSLWGYLDVDSTTPIVQIDSNFTLTDLTASVLSNQKYDTVKVHLAAGYDFPGLDGFILEIQWDQWSFDGTSNKKFTAAAQTYLKSAPNISYSTEPLFLGDRFYDRYVEFKVPSLSYVNEDYWNSPSASNTLGYQYTFDNVGFSQTSLIYANLYEIDSTQTRSGNSYFNTGNIYRTSFNAADQYTYVGAVVKENTEFNYIEYYPTYNDGYIEDYLTAINEAPGGDWIVINQLNVYEQAGTTFARTASMTLLQEDNFNEPAIFRPVIRNAAFIYSFTVEYIMRLVNKVNNKEVIRKATVTSFNPKKYGYSLEKINVLEGFRPVKVYNKIEKIESTALVNSIVENEGAFGFGTPKIITQNIYVNNYYDVNYISVDSTTNVGDVIGQTVYTQGLNYIFINKFDNYVKFKIFTKSADKRQNVTLDLASTGMDIKLSFIYDDDSKIYIDPVSDLSVANPGAGEVLFKLDDAISTKLINGKNREYYIINKNAIGDEVLVYYGKFESQDKKLDIMAKINQVKIDELNATITKLQKAQEVLKKQLETATTQTVVVAAPTTTTVTPVTATVAATTVAATATSPANAVVTQNQQSEVKAIEQATTFVTSASQGVQDAIKQAAADETKTVRSIKLFGKTFNIPDIPGITPNLGSPITLAVTPKVINPKKPNKNKYIKAGIK